MKVSKWLPLYYKLTTSVHWLHLFIDNLYSWLPLSSSCTSRGTNKTLWMCINVLSDWMLFIMKRKVCVCVYMFHFNFLLVLRDVISHFFVVNIFLVPAIVFLFILLLYLPKIKSYQHLVKTKNKLLKYFV